MKKACFSLVVLALLGAPLRAQTYKSWAAATGFTGVPVTDVQTGLGLAASARTAATSPLGGTGVAYGYAWTEVGKLHVLSETRTDSLSFLAGSDQNFAYAGRDNNLSFDLASPSFYATAAQFVVTDLVVSGVGAASISLNMSMHALLQNTASTGVGNFAADSGFTLAFKASQGGAEVASGTLKVGRDVAGSMSQLVIGALPALGGLAPTINTSYMTNFFTVDRGVPITVDWFLSAYGVSFTNGGNATQSKADLSSTFSWATAGPVVTIMGGGTANSAQGGISNNLFSSSTSAPEPGSLVFLSVGVPLVILTRRHGMEREL